MIFAILLLIPTYFSKQCPCESNVTLKGTQLNAIKVDDANKIHPFRNNIGTMNKFNKNVHLDNTVERGKVVLSKNIPVSSNWKKSPYYLYADGNLGIKSNKGIGIHDVNEDKPINPFIMATSTGIPKVILKDPTSNEKRSFIQLVPKNAANPHGEYKLDLHNIDAIVSTSEQYSLFSAELYDTVNSANGLFMKKEGDIYFKVDDVSGKKRTQIPCEPVNFRNSNLSVPLLYITQDPDDTNKIKYSVEKLDNKHNIVTYMVPFTGADEEDAYKFIDCNLHYTDNSLFACKKRGEHTSVGKDSDGFHIFSHLESETDLDSTFNKIYTAQDPVFPELDTRPMFFKLPLLTTYEDGAGKWQVKVEVPSMNFTWDFLITEINVRIRCTVTVYNSKGDTSVKFTDSKIEI